MIRRDFIKGLGMLGAVVIAPVVTHAQRLSGISRDLTTTQLKGRVLANGKGLAGVAMTDGINAVQTNARGEYTLLSNKTTSYIYMSLPAGYAFPHEQSVTRFYRAIDHRQKTFTADFVLQALPGSDDKHAFVLWADPQIQSREDAQKLLTESAPDLKALVSSYTAGTLFHGIGCGDLVWDKFELFADYKQAIAQSGIPFFQVIGNHDMDLEARTDEGSSKTFESHFGPSYYSYNRGKIHYVVLDDVFFVGVDKRYIGYLDERQLAWLEQDLQYVKPGATVVVSLHIPSNTGKRRRYQEDSDDMGGVVLNRERLYALLKPYNVHILSGHTHVSETWEEKNIMEHNHGAVCGAWWTGPICGDGTPNGYGVYEVDGNDLTWYYKATGRPKEHQLRAYVPGRHREFHDEVCINVWNWDKAWKIECFADGKSIGSPEQRTALDPWSVELHEGATKPVPRRWVEPSLTDHLFFIKPPADTKKFEVVCTDRFNNRYTETLSL
ncbi:calcineurin-like phosphoesterase C-terminal domain-containing protein [Dawidia soli]|uniref:Calcineurin-like phosphoesterase C-terminal domain-containing protein n=1 Tax=Dawidia soli TaxID=2782352 RepID=A0AAP2GC47_9BACT|nr:calcineurin-like phosphoesterase family protein [Dawidia soli]MBT1685894.1 calcineurin-like phosphoesterase C-terminal domain-containing protein [Dawidia soli]